MFNLIFGWMEMVRQWKGR